MLSSRNHVSTLLDTFEVKDGHGSHLCLVYEAMGSLISCFQGQEKKVPVTLVKSGEAAATGLGSASQSMLQYRSYNRACNYTEISKTSSQIVQRNRKSSKNHQKPLK
jgi:hypothetical protein